jgi:hypothetical protein
MTRDVETVERVIPAPAGRIFAVVADPRRHREIDGSGTVRDAVETPGQLALGSTFGMDMHLGRSYSMVSTVVEYEENRRIAWQSRPSIGLMRQIFGGRIWRYELEPVEGGTRVRESWDISQERLKTIVRPYRHQTRANMTSTLERLERLLEKDAPS